MIETGKGGATVEEKSNAGLLVGMILAIIFAFTIADFFKSDRVFSETENRVLASKPEFSKAALLQGEYTEDYEEYVTDQFVSRDKWIGIKTWTDILLQKKEINNIYLGKDDYLIEKHNPDDYSEELVKERLAALKEFVDRWDAQVMLAPTADNILTDKLPAYALYYDEAAFLEQVKSTVGEEHYVDVYGALAEHKDEAIYYRTDHHWTSLGAYYGFLAWAEHMGKFPYPYNVNNMTTVSDEFLGTLHSRINIDVKTDSIQYFPETELRPVSVTYDLVEKTDSLYEESYLTTKNKYGYFLDDNHGFVEIKTEYKNGKTLFVVKDSYANCLIPLLTTHYETIYVIDLRYFNGRLFPFMESYEPEEGMDVLLLYNCIHFLEDFKYY